MAAGTEKIEGGKVWNLDCLGISLQGKMFAENIIWQTIIKLFYVKHFRLYAEYVWNMYSCNYWRQ